MIEMIQTYIPLSDLWLGIILSGLGFIILYFSLINRVKLQIRAEEGEERTRLATEINILKQHNNDLRDESSNKDDLIRDLREQNTTLKTTLQHERESIEKQLNTLEKAKDDLGNIFKAMGQEALQANNKAFLDLAKENFEKEHLKSQEDLKKREVAIEQMVKPVSQSLEKMDQKIADIEKERKGAYEGLKQHLSTMAEDQTKLRSETAHLVQALRSPTKKGQWGEMHLKNTVKMAGLIDHVDFVEQEHMEDDGKIHRPDMIVNMPGGQKIIVDAKAPIDAYYDALKEDLTDKERDEALSRLARLVKDHVKTLASKAYWNQFESPEFVVMFLPSEGIFSTAVEKDPSLLQYGIEQKVIPASPTTLVALLRAVGYGWKQEKLAENAREISDLGSELYGRLATFGTHLEKLGRSLNSTMNSYNSAVGSLESSVLPSARRFNELHVTTKSKEIPTLSASDINARSITAPELIQKIDKTAKTEDKSKKTLKKSTKKRQKS